MASIEPEVIDIETIGNAPIITLNKNDSETTHFSEPSSFHSKPSVNFGGGIELLMNDKRRSDNKSPSADIDLGDILKLEDELNELSAPLQTSTQSKSKSGLFNDSLKLNFSDKDETITIDNNEKYSGISIGKSTAEQQDDDSSKTWDGFGKFNNIPIDPDRSVEAQPKLSHEELLREKFKIKAKLDNLAKKGVKLSKQYTMESSLTEMQGEYEMLVEDKERSNSCKFQGRMLMAAITGLEFLNNRFDPFDVKLDGWAEQVNENIDDYDEIFAELHEKYKSKAKMAPELKLLFQLGGSAIMVHMTNTMFKSAMPGMDDIMRQNPELAQQFTQAAVNSMSDSNPGFSGFMNNVMGDRRQPPPPPNVARGPPPEPMPTQVNRSQRSQVPTNRPDVFAARGNDDEGTSIQDKYSNVGTQRSSKNNAPKRPEMKGPSDISDLLGGLKTKTINIQGENNKKDNSSTISIQDLKDLSNAKEPTRSKKRPKSEKNTISLDM